MLGWNPYHKPPPGSIINEQHPLAPDKLCLLFNEGVGSERVYDLTRGRMHGTLTNMVAASDWTPGRDGWAMDFDGSNDHVLLSSSADGTPLDAGGHGEWSIAAWVYPTTTGSEYKYIAWWDDGPPSYEYMLNITSGGAWSTFYRTSGGFRSVTGNAVTTNAWTHIVGTMKSGDAVRIYENGVQTGSTGIGSENIQTASDTSVAVGAGFNTPPTVANPFPGKLGFVGMWSRTLLAAEAKQLYLQPYCFIRTPAPRKWYWETAAGASITVTPAAIAMTGALGTPTTAYDFAHPIAAALGLTGAVPAPTILTDLTVEIAAALGLTAAVPAPTITYDMVFAIGAALGINMTAVDPDVLAGLIVEIAAALSLTATAKAPTTLYDFVVAIAAAVGLTASQPSPTVLYDFKVALEEALQLRGTANSPQIGITGTPFTYPLLPSGLIEDVIPPEDKRDE